MSNHVPIPKAPWWLPFAFTALMAGVSYGVSAYVSYTHTDKAMAVDVATLKTQREADKEQINRIEAKVDRLIETITWALGKPKG